MAENEFSTFDVVRLIGIKLDRLRDWINSGFIKPTAIEKIKRGDKSYFDLWGLYMIGLFHYVISNGISRQKAAKMINELTAFKKKMGNKKPNVERANFVILKRLKGEIVDCHVAWGPTPAIKTNEDIDDVYTVNFSKIRAQVDSALSE